MVIAMIGQKGLPARSGGVERHVSLLARGLASRGHRVIVYGRRWYGRRAHGVIGVEQRLMSGVRTKHLDAITHCVAAILDLRRTRPDIVHIHGTGPALLAPLVRLLYPRTKLVITFHCIDWQHGKWGGFAQLAFRVGEWMACHAAHRTFTVSQALVRYCQETYGCQATYVTHPYEVPAHTPSARLLQAHDITPGMYLLTVSRLVSHKHIHTLLAAYAEARKREPALFASVPLVVVGAGSWTDEYVTKLRTQAANIPGVLMLGERSGAELESLQAHALAHVLPSVSEGMSFSLVEAGGYGRPVVLSDIEHNRELASESALYFPPGDVECLTRALIEIVATPNASRELLGSDLASRVHKMFSYGDRIDDVLRQYHEVVHGDGRLVSVHPRVALALKTA